MVVDRGPKPDDLEFRPLLKAACRRHPFRTLLADCGYDAEHHHRFLNDTLGVIGIIPPTRGLHRRFLHQHWPRIKPLYGQRWQSESYLSMSKRLLDSFLRSRKRANRDRELHLRNITMNLMVAADP